MPSWFPALINCESDWEAAQQQWEDFQHDMQEMREKGEI